MSYPEFLLRLANSSLFKVAQRLRRCEGFLVCLAERPQAVPPDTLKIFMSRAAAKRLHQSVRQRFQNSE